MRQPIGRMAWVETTGQKQEKGRFEQLIETPCKLVADEDEAAFVKKLEKISRARSKRESEE